jgi:hypothetical protein
MQELQISPIAAAEHDSVLDSIFTRMNANSSESYLDASLGLLMDDAASEAEQQEEDLTHDGLNIFTRYQVDGEVHQALMDKANIQSVIGFCQRFSGLSESQAKAGVERMIADMLVVTSYEAHGDDSALKEVLDAVDKLEGQLLAQTEEKT